MLCSENHRLTTATSQSVRLPCTEPQPPLSNRSSSERRPSSHSLIGLRNYLQHPAPSASPLNRTEGWFITKKEIERSALIHASELRVYQRAVLLLLQSHVVSWLVTLGTWYYRTLFPAGNVQLSFYADNSSDGITGLPPVGLLKKLHLVVSFFAVSSTTTVSMVRGAWTWDMYEMKRTQLYKKTTRRKSRRENEQI